MKSSNPKHARPSSRLKVLIDVAPFRKFACPFPTSTVAVAPALLQLVVPHSNPLGQHPFPTSAAHPNQPEAQLPTAVVVALGTRGTATVTPELTMTIEAVEGQNVAAQFLSTLQQPAPG
jgi:hypothetical protein